MKTLTPVSFIEASTPKFSESYSDSHVPAKEDMYASLLKSAGRARLKKFSYCPYSSFLDACTSEVFSRQYSEESDMPIYCVAIGVTSIRKEKKIRVSATVQRCQGHLFT